MSQETTSPDITSKDSFFAQLAQLSDQMIAAYDKDFAMGALVLAARFIAEGQDRAQAAGTSPEALPKKSSLILQ